MKKIKFFPGRRPLEVQRLEDRRVFASFGTPWPNARSLSVSFPTDQASIGHYSNSIREVFDQVADRREWQETALLAFQTWAAHANLNIGLVPDRGDRFGALGLTTNDPRFGEFRIGAFPQPGVLASAAPFQPSAGTWSGDVLLNTQANYFLGDWQSNEPIQVPASNDKGPAIELFSVFLHEAGNALGLPDVDSPADVMSGNYTGPKGQLTDSDIRAIRALYGPRRDPFEATNNDTRAKATAIANPRGFNGSVPLVVNGSLNSRRDIDFYRFQPLRNQEKVTVRLWASGISLLKANLEVQTASGVKIADVRADSIFENNIELEIGSLADHRSLVIRVNSVSKDAFSIGDYRLEIDYRPDSEQPSLLPPIYDSDGQGESDDDDDTIDFVSVDALFDSFGLLDTELGTNDTLVSAGSLETTPGFNHQTRYEIPSAISGRQDRDLWRFQTPDFDSPVLRIDIDPIGIGTPQLEPYLLTSSGDRLETYATQKAGGGWSLVVDHPPRATELILFIRIASDSVVSSGNYLAAIDFATNDADNMEQLYNAEVLVGEEHISQLDVNKSQLFRFDLSAMTANGYNNGVQLTLYNAFTGDIVSTFATIGNQVRTEFVWLAAGSYLLRASLSSQDNQTSAPVLFTLFADVLSDDQGPNPVDPTNPTGPSNYPDYDWRPVNPQFPPPAIGFLDPPVEDPWNSDFYLDYFVDFYFTFLQ